LKQESSSWSRSTSLGRASGSTVASAILQSIVAIEESGLNETEVRDHPTYISLALSIHESLKRLDTFANEQKIHFSAQDDAWESNYRHRLGLPLTHFKKRWETLRPIPPSPPAADSAEGTSRMYGSLLRRRKRMLEFRAREYLASYPGLDELAPNVSLHGRLRRLIAGTQKFTPDQIDSLFSAVTYRLSVLHQADEITQDMNLNMGSIFNFCVEIWKPSSEQSKLRDRNSKRVVYLMILSKQAGHTQSR
jgi:hypothetical protein